jgi:hypothetical protein
MDHQGFYRVADINPGDKKYHGNNRMTILSQSSTGLLFILPQEIYKW